MTVQDQHTRHLSDAGRANERMHDNDLRSDGFQARDVRTQFIKLSIPGDFKHKCMVHELPMLEVQTDVLGEALMQPKSRYGMDRKDNESRMNIRWK